MRKTTRWIAVASTVAVGWAAAAFLIPSPPSDTAPRARTGRPEPRD